jgi:hypothetical protein
MRAMEERPRVCVSVELDQRAGVDHGGHDFGALSVSAGAPVHAIWFGVLGDSAHPREQHWIGRERSGHALGRSAEFMPSPDDHEIRPALPRRTWSMPRMLTHAILGTDSMIGDHLATICRPFASRWLANDAAEVSRF